MGTRVGETSRSRVVGIRRAHPVLGDAMRRGFAILTLLALASLACGVGSLVSTATPKRPPRITVISAQRGMSDSGHIQVVFQVRNDDIVQVRYIKVRIDCYLNGAVVDTDWAYSSPEHLNPGETGTNRAWFRHATKCDDIKVYSVTTD